MATAPAKSPVGPKVAVTFPPEPKPESSVPSTLYRARAKSKSGRVTTVSPAVTILPSGWTATAWAVLPPAPKSVVTLPPEPKVESRVPSGR